VRASCYRFSWGIEPLSTVWMQIQAEVSGMVPHDIPKEGKFKCWPSAGKIMATLSWDFKGVNFMSCLPGDSSELCLLYRNI